MKCSLHNISCQEDPEGKYKYNSSLSLTSALDGVGDQNQALSALTPVNSWYQ